MLKIVTLSIQLTLLTQHLVFAQDYVDECPVDFGFFADAVQCDRYYECKEGEIFDRYCPDGLVYDEASVQYAKCGFPFSVDCTDRPELQPAQATKLCPRQNGYFAHENPEVCDKFYFCVDGVENPITCPASLIFDPNLGQCAYSDQVKRKGCSSVDFFNFECPKVKDAKHEHPRYPDPDDCQYFFICISGQARRNGCQTGQVFNKETLGCDAQANLKGDPQCRNWYNETVMDTVTVRPRPGGVPINTEDRQRVVVRRRKPRPPQQQVSVSTSESFSTGPVSSGSLNPRDQVRSQGSQRPTVSPSIGASRPNRQKVRQRVRRPQVVPQQELVPVEEGPPKFALDNEEAIQKFRDSNPFGPQSDVGRLTVLNSDPVFTNQPRRDQFRDSDPFGSQSDGGRLSSTDLLGKISLNLNSGSSRQPPRASQPRKSLVAEPVFTNPPRRDQFRDSNQFGSQSDAGSRLTILNSGSSRQPPLASQPRKSLVAEPVFTNPPRRDSFIPQSFSDPFSNSQETFPESPIRSFAAVPAVPEPVEQVEEIPIEPATFGSRFQSRRPPTIQRPVQEVNSDQSFSRQPQPQQQQQQFSRQRPQSDQDFTRTRPTSDQQQFSRQRPSDQDQQQFSRPRPTAAAAARQPSPTIGSFNPVEFEPQRQQQQFSRQRPSGQDFTRQEETSGGRQRLEVTEIKVRPQLQAQDFNNNESLNIDDFRQVANRFRQRGSQQQ